MASKNNPAGPLPALVALVASVCAVLGVSLETSAQVQAATAAGGALVVAVWQWQHHRTVRNFDNASAAAIAAKSSVQAAAHAATAAEAQAAAHASLAAAAEANKGNGWPVAHADAHPLTAEEWQTAADAVRRLRPAPAVGSAS